MNDNTEADIEIQLTELKVWAERSLFYLAKMYTEQILSGQKYGVFKKCVSISVLDFDLFRGETEFYSCFHIREDARNFLYTDKMEFHVIELPKLPKTPKEGCSGLELWARFINAERKEEFDILAQKDPYIASAYGQLQTVSLDREKRLEYEARQKAIRDYSQMMHEATEQGRKQGERIGREQGERIGREQGEERINKLNAILLKEQRFEDLARSVNDKGFQRKLMELYGI